MIYNNAQLFYSNTHKSHERFQPVADLHHEFVPNPGAYRVVPVESFQPNKEVKMGPVVQSVTILGNEPFKIHFLIYLILDPTINDDFPKWLWGK